MDFLRDTGKNGISQATLPVTMKTDTQTSHPPVSNPRLLAVEAIVRVTRDQLPLALPIQADQLETRDRGLAFEIAFGTIRYLSLLDAILASCIPRPLSKKRHFMRAVLRSALYQSLYMRVPGRAAVNEAINMVKLSPEKAHAGFANAVLRKAITVDPETVMARVADPVQQLALRYAHPTWMVQRWLEQAERQVVIQRMKANNLPATLTLRTNTLQRDRAALLEALAPSGALAAPLTPDALLVPAGGAVESMVGFSEGWFAVQDQAAQWVSRLLDPQPGDHLLDACAAPGGKTAHLAALAQGQAEIIAVEKFPSRLERMAQNFKRLGVPGVTVCPGDASLPELLVGKQFDRILVDAPCTGTGVIRRHPEIKWRRRPKDIPSLMQDQAAILSAVAGRLRPGGVLVYATCSMEPEENEQRVERFLADHPTWCRDPVTVAKEGVPGDTLSERGDFRVEPGQHAMDGFFAARLRRQS
ncbi:MAG: 16S rRNA (cytosine(967)-C(5))-methyltransferase RsmB [Magnetococcales bacterium]|nr:16S rRNA (cytosine(967)-C(5))-methyltransferase RsmB [Magnetococcales bacterium]